MKKEDALFAVSNTASVYAVLPEKFRKDRDVLLKALEKNPEAILDGFRYFKDDKEVIMKAMSPLVPNFRPYLWQISRRLKRDPDIALQALSVYKKTMLLRGFHESLRGDKEFLLKYLTQAKSLLKKKMDFSFLNVSRQLRSDGEFVLKLLGLLGTDFSGDDFNYLGRNLKADKEFMTKVVKYHPESYLVAVANIRKDKALAFEAIKGCGFCIAKSPFKADKAMVKVAITTSPASFKFASKRVRKNKDLAKEVFSQDGFLLNNFPEWQGDRDMVEVAYRSKPLALGFASKELKKDRSFMYRAYKYDPKTATYIDESLCEDMVFLLSLNVLENWGFEVKKFRP